MNDEQLRQPQDMLAEQDSGLNGSANAGNGADESSIEAGTGSMATDATDSDINGLRPEADQALEQTDQDNHNMEMANNAIDASDMTVSLRAEEPATEMANNAIDADDAGDMTASLRPDEPADVAPTTVDPPVFTGAVESYALTQPVVDLPVSTITEQPIVEDAAVPEFAQEASAQEASVPEQSIAGDAGAGVEALDLEEGEPGDGEAPIVRTSRDPRLTEMAPNASMEDLLKASEQQYRTLKHGDVIEGTVMKVDRDEILVDIGSKSEGIIPSHELQSLSAEERETMKVGDELLVSVVQPENNEGHAVLSLDRARQEKSWRDLQKKFEDSEVIQAEVSGYNKGGLLVNLGGVRGFVPSSQVSSLSGGEANKQSEMSKLQGQALPLKIIEINRSRNRLILSERQAVQEQRESMRSRLLKELETGQTRPGTVSSICDFGAFVDIGGADGLIHLSELSWKRVSHPSEVLKVGDRISVYVLSVDASERKIALSLKRTQPEPWSTITDNYHLGQVVKGTITQLTSFGAFARLEDGIEGLIHVSELAEGRVAHPRNVVKEGDTVELKVIRIDPVKKRIGLSLKRMNEDAEGGTENADAAGGVVDEDTAASTTETPGAYGVADETPVAQRDATPAAEQTQGARPPRPSQPPARKPEPKPQAQPKIKVPEDEEPMGAMAHAFAMLAQSQQAAPAEEATEEIAPDETPIAQVAPEEMATAEAAIATMTAPEDTAPVETTAAGEPEAMLSPSEAEDTMSSAAAMEVSEPEVDSTASEAQDVAAVEPEVEVEAAPAESEESEPEVASEEESEPEVASEEAASVEESASEANDADSEVLPDAVEDTEDKVEADAESTDEETQGDAEEKADDGTTESDTNEKPEPLG